MNNESTSYPPVEYLLLTDFLVLVGGGEGSKAKPAKTQAAMMALCELCMDVRRRLHACSKAQHCRGTLSLGASLVVLPFRSPVPPWKPAALWGSGVHIHVGLWNTTSGLLESTAPTQPCGVCSHFVLVPLFHSDRMWKSLS